VERASASRPVVLITGASGLIGQRVARALVPAYHVIGLDVQLPASRFPPQAGFVECDLTSEEATQRAIETVGQGAAPIASVVHLAAYYDFSGEPSPLYHELTVEGTRRLVRAVRESLHPEQFVFSSSLLMMRPAPEDGVLDETSPLCAEWDYPAIEAGGRVGAARGARRSPRGRAAGGAYDEDGNSPPLPGFDRARAAPPRVDASPATARCAPAHDRAPGPRSAGVVRAQRPADRRRRPP